MKFAQMRYPPAPITLINTTIGNMEDVRDAIKNLSAEKNRHYLAVRNTKKAALRIALDIFTVNPKLNRYKPRLQALKQRCIISMNANKPTT